MWQCGWAVFLDQSHVFLLWNQQGSLALEGDQLLSVGVLFASPLKVFLSKEVKFTFFVELLWKNAV